MKKLLLGLTLLASINSFANSWSDIDFGQIPLTKNFKVSGTLDRGLIFKKEITISLEMEKEFIGNNVNDNFYSNKSYHRVQFSIDGDKICDGISFLGTEDEMGKDIKYAMVVNYDYESRADHCPYQIQIDFGEMEESSEEVEAVLTLYKTNDLSKKKKFSGILKKY